MIKKLDWYILKQFVVAFIFCMLLFTVLAVAVDTSEKTDDFVKTGFNWYQIFMNYYIGFIPFIWGLLYPIFVFIAVIFFTSRMAYRSEIIAILASGTSYNRWSRPYYIGGLFFAIILYFANHYAIPKANEIQYGFKAKYIDDHSSSPNNYTSNIFYKNVDSNTFIGIKYYDTASKTAAGFFLNRVKNDTLVYNLRADNMKWDTAKKNWHLTNVLERKLDTAHEVVKIIPQMNIDLKLRPDELKKDEYLKDKLNTPELASLIKREELRGTEGLSALKVEQYRRTASAFSVLLLTLIGAFIASRKTRGGSGLNLAIGIIIAAMFVISDRFSTVFAVKGNLHPLFAAWIPNIFFTGVAYFVHRKSPK